LKKFADRPISFADACLIRCAELHDEARSSPMTATPASTDGRGTGSSIFSDAGTLARLWSWRSTRSGPSASVDRRGPLHKCPDQYEAPAGDASRRRRACAPGHPLTVMHAAGVSATATARAVPVLDGPGPWSEAPHRAAGKRAERFRAASSVPVIRVDLTRPPAHLCAWHLSSRRIRTRRGSERTSEARFPASRKRASDGQCRRGAAAAAPDRDATRGPKRCIWSRPAAGHRYTRKPESIPRPSSGV
jgi:hypothetical protein